MAVRLSEAGYFSWQEWTETIAAELKAAADAGNPDDGTHYYHHWLAALEKLVTAKGLASVDELAARKRAWKEAYLHTPHGRPVQLDDVAAIQ